MTDGYVSDSLEQMKIKVSREANRAVSFTNKEACFYYTQTHVNDHPEHAYFEGMNVAKNRIFGGYTLYADHQELDNELAEVQVSPYSLVRIHGSITEELCLFDYRNVLEVSLTGGVGSIGISFKGEELEFLELTKDTVYFKAMEGDWIIALRAKGNGPLMMDREVFQTNGAAGGFFISAAATAEEAALLIEDTERQAAALKAERIRRMDDFLQNNVYLDSSNEELKLALNWISLTMDQLVTRQQGRGSTPDCRGSMNIGDGTSSLQCRERCWSAASLRRRSRFCCLLRNTRTRTNRRNITAGFRIYWLLKTLTITLQTVRPGSLCSCRIM